MTMSQARWAVGLISGTSMDGIDAALVKISGSPNRPHVSLRAFITLPYPASVRKRLLELAGGSPTTAGEISTMNFALGELFAQAALAVCGNGRVSPRRLAVIGSHGQTVFHQGPAAGIRRTRARRTVRGHTASTLQIGEAAVIAERTGAPVVADFRTADMAAGGHGAPLVPMADYLLLRDAKFGVVALNIGGIANVTVIPAGARPEDVTGFDTGPGNMVIDGLVRQFSSGGKKYDAGGKWAEQGEVIEPLVAKLLRLPYFERNPPKSAGREQFGAEFVKRYFLSRASAASADLLRTATELTARSIADSFERWVLSRTKIQRLIVSGGGAHNSFLLERIGALLPGVEVRLADSYGLPVDAKEAIAFALLAHRTLHGLPGNLPSVTGARRTVVLGKV
ncbi:MAG TPA: anhydro-N-acetylmuramic acid kinase, partial [Terriglobia bacterium]|nr:anhydro-N-acetylmuramic acid kinase [Terriglobia bacterium]